MLFLEGTTDVFGGGLVHMTDSVPLAFGFQATAFLAFGVLTFAYLWFLATLPSPATRPLDHRGWSLTLVGAMISFSVLFLLRTDLFLAGMGPGPTERLQPLAGPWTLPGLVVPSLPVFAFGLVAAILMWRNAPPSSAARRQGAAYAAAFGIRDVAWFGFLLASFILTVGLWIEWIFSLLLLAFYLVLAYGILRTQLLGIDLHVKWTLRRGTLVGMLAAAFFVAKEAVEALLPGEGAVAGIAGAAVVAGLALPVWKAASALAERVMPQVQETRSYRERRKKEIYAAALEDLSRDGRLSPDDRAQLDRLNSKLGLEAV